MINLFGYDFSVSELVAMSLSLLLTVFYAIKTGGIKNLIKEVNLTMLKFRSQQSENSTVGQTFDKTKPEYRYNKATGELEETGNTIDVQEIINSCADMVLSKVMERFLPAVSERENLIADYGALKDDLDELAGVMEKAEEYRSYFGLGDEMSVSDIYAFVESKAKEVKKSIEDIDKKIKLGGKEDEKKKDDEPSQE